MLPVIQLPTYDLALPSSGKIITIRPFTVKEEKLLLIALESGSEAEIIQTTKQVIKNCIVDPVDFNLDSRPFFDIDFLFIALRAKSIGDSVNVKFRCEHNVNGQACGNIFPVKLDIADTKIDFDTSIEKEIKVTPTVKLKMKYPSYTDMKIILNTDHNINKKIYIISSSIEYVQEKERITKASDIPREEIIKFIEGLTTDKFKLLEHFVDNFPTFHIQAKTTCEKCGFEHTLRYTDFTKFFQ